MAYVGEIATQIEVNFEYEPWARFWLDLASSTRLIFHDRRGTGLSDAGDGLPNLETRAADLRAVLEAVGSSQPYLFGLGDGGAVCALHAATHPDQVAGFLWYLAAARPLQAPDWPHGDPPEDVEMRVEGVAARWGTLDFVREYSEVEGPIDDQAARWLAKLQRAFCGPKTAERYIRLLYEGDVRAVLPALRVPTLLLDADAGDENWAGMAGATAALIPGAEYRRLPGMNWIWDDAEHRLDIIRSFLGVERPAPVFDRVLATVLFTDIVGSTETAARLGDRGWRDVVERHHTTVRGLLARYRGIEVDTAGDGFFATFDGPARAVMCATAIIEAVKPTGVEVRAGVHTGEVQMIAGKTGGMAVAIGSRVGGMAGASEVLVSQTVKDLTVGSGLVFGDAGEHELKGVPDRWRLYWVAG